MLGWIETSVIDSCDPLAYWQFQRSLATQSAVADSPAVLAEKLTGPGSPNTAEARFGVKATDVGLMWENSRGRYPRWTVADSEQDVVDQVA